MWAKFYNMAPKHQSVAVQRGATMKSHSYSKYGFIFLDTGLNVTNPFNVKNEWRRKSKITKIKKIWYWLFNTSRKVKLVSDKILKNISHLKCQKLTIQTRDQGMNLYKVHLIFPSWPRSKLHYIRLVRVSRVELSGQLSHHVTHNL